jgi:hypothetical protein
MARFWQTPRDMHDAGVEEGAIPLVVDPSRGYRAANLELIQGLYLLATGVWPLVSPATFQKVTGPKREMWLTKTVGVLAGVMGGVLVYAGSRRRRPSEVILLAMGSAAAFLAIDVVYVAKRRIAPVYLVDAAAQVGLLAWWTFGRGRLPWRRKDTELETSNAGAVSGDPLSNAGAVRGSTSTAWPNGR